MSPNIEKVKQPSVMVDMVRGNFKVLQSGFRAFQHEMELPLPKTVSKEEAAMSMDDVNCRGKKLDRVWETCKPESLFNASETALSYDLLSERTLAVKPDRCERESIQKYGSLPCSAGTASGTPRFKPVTMVCL